MRKDNQSGPMFLRISEVARQLSMCRTAAYNAMRAGAIPAIRIDGKWRVPRAALEKMVAEALAARADGDVPKAV